jgi:3-hydroxyacyl-[acyl-carrier-protein] dehydratase
MDAKSNEIFHLTNLGQSDGEITASLDINKSCPIFKGHFPGQPVVPGACMLQLVKDVLEQALAADFQLKKAGHLKFTSMIVPAVNDMLELHITYKPILDGVLHVTAKLVDGEIICFKFQGSFVEV